MRPVSKKNVGEYLTVGGQDVVVSDPKKHRDSLEALVANLGAYCSYCEVASLNHANLQVEHVQPLSRYPDLKLKWSNFLLGCPNCNGRSNKTNKDVVLDEIHLPHRNNTYYSLIYKEAGVVKVNPTLTGKSKTNAENLVSLLNLDKEDARCDMRRDIWNKAQAFHEEYVNGEIQLIYLMKYIKAVGCWSIWFTVFKDRDEVRKALIDEFEGTAKNCFDPGNHYEPIPRNPQNAADPV